MPRRQNTTRFVAASEAILLDAPRDGDAVNHLILGDWLKLLGEQDGNWAKVRSRAKTGWLKKSEFSEDRALEINFVDVGQGDGCHIVTPKDDIILIDAGVGDNMARFLSWRYNLRERNVAGTPDFNPDEDDKGPWEIENVVISHPDNDHYYGLRDVFKNPKLRFTKVYHNGIIERPAEPQDPNLSYPDDLGGYAEVDRKKYIWDVVSTDARLKQISAAHPRTTKQLLSTIRACLENSGTVKFKNLGVRSDRLHGQPVFMGDYDGSDDQHGLALRVIGPVTEKVNALGQNRHCLRKLGSEGVTKNGHSVILMLRYGKLRVMLGGDLNSQSQDFLLQQYGVADTKVTKLEKKAAKLRLSPVLEDRNEEKLKEIESQLDRVATAARPIFECDVAKACHHGSPHISDTFLRALNATATVISSGDGESHGHPRPNALGAYGKHGRGERPLIFSTELARSTNEFTPITKHFDALKGYMALLEATDDAPSRRKIEREMEMKKDRNVAVYGMITLRALGERVIVAQKLEVPRNAGAKWVVYELAYNERVKAFQVLPQHH